MNTPVDLRSPYQPPTADLSQPAEALPPLPPHERSPAPKVFGVLSIVFASIMLLFAAMGLLGSVATRAAGAFSGAAASADPAKAAEVAAMMGPMTKIYAGIGYQSAILFVMSAVLLAIGIGQLRYRAWARRWSVTWGVAGLVCVALLAAISMLVISPAYGDMFESMGRLKGGGDGNAEVGAAMSGVSSIFGGTFAVLCVIVYAPYPALMLLFFTRERVRASMTG
jgi:hypothetical protein